MVPFSALQCRLHCEPGYVPHRDPVVTCTDGTYEPAKPSSFVCQPAAALVFSQSGEVEVVSEKCSMVLTHFRDFSGHGRTASLLDDQILLIGNSTLSGSEGNFLSIQNPRDGLLAMKYTKETFSRRGSPFQHVALHSKNKLNLFGGKYKSRVRLEQSTWMDIQLTWEETQKAFVPKFFSACTVQSRIDTFYIFGGAEIQDNKTIAVRNTVLQVNTTSLRVKIVGTMNRPRMAFGCEVLKKSLFLLSGGYSNATQPHQSIAPDEIFNATHHILAQKGDSLNSTGSILLTMADSLQRAQHKLIRMSDKVYAFGGITSGSSNATTRTIKVFNEAAKTWENHNRSLKSNETGDLVLLPFPTSSLDCVPVCQCGVASSTTTRIFNGTDTEVNFCYSQQIYLPLFFTDE